MWARSGDFFELAVELEVPADLRSLLGEPTFDTIRYEISIGSDPATRELGFKAERAFLKVRQRSFIQRDFFPRSVAPPKTILSHLKGQDISHDH